MDTGIILSTGNSRSTSSLFYSFNRSRATAIRRKVHPSLVLSKLAACDFLQLYIIAIISTLSTFRTSHQIERKKSGTIHIISSLPQVVAFTHSHNKELLLTAAMNDRSLNVQIDKKHSGQRIATQKKQAETY